MRATEMFAYLNGERKFRLFTHFAPWQDGYINALKKRPEREKQNSIESNINTNQNLRNKDNG